MAPSARNAFASANASTCCTSTEFPSNFTTVPAIVMNGWPASVGPLVTRRKMKRKAKTTSRSVRIAIAAAATIGSGAGTYRTTSPGSVPLFFAILRRPPSSAASSAPREIDDRADEHGGEDDREQARHARRESARGVRRAFARALPVVRRLGRLVVLEQEERRAVDDEEEHERDQAREAHVRRGRLVLRDRRHGRRRDHREEGENEEDRRLARGHGGRIPTSVFNPSVWTFQTREPDRRCERRNAIKDEMAAAVR